MSVGPRDVLRRYLRDVLIPAYYASPEHGELEHALDCEIVRVCDALGVDASQELEAQCGRGLSGYEVEAAFAAIGGRS